MTPRDFKYQKINISSKCNILFVNANLSRSNSIIAKNIRDLTTLKKLYKSDSPFNSRQYGAHFLHIAYKVIHIAFADFVIATIILENLIAIPAGHDETWHNYSVPLVAHQILEYWIFASLTPVSYVKRS